MSRRASDEILPTLSSPEWSIASLYDSVVAALSDGSGSHLRLLFYAVTTRGWAKLRPAVKGWLTRKGTQCTAYVGTDHGVTDPDALKEMMRDGVKTRMMMEYRGVFHPKIFWIERASEHSIWIGSNNLTDGGFLQNIECAFVITAAGLPDAFRHWFELVHASSEQATSALIDDYQRERDKFVKKHGSGGAFTWSKRREPPPPEPEDEEPEPTEEEVLAPPGSLILEIMPRETGPGGKQIQLPKKAPAMAFFGVGTEVGATATIRLRSTETGDARSLTMTVYENRTVRLSIKELNYSDRPCVIIFEHKSGNRYDFEIVQRAVWPDRYRTLLGACGRPTRAKSRRWTIL